MPTYKGRWEARVEQEFEVQAENEEEARERVSWEHPVEIIDFEITRIEKVEDET